MKYKIIDKQIKGREFADGAIFYSKDDILEQLIDFHLIDAEEPEKLKAMNLNEILEHGEWELEESEEEKCLHSYCDDGAKCIACGQQQ